MKNNPHKLTTPRTHLSYSRPLPLILSSQSSPNRVVGRGIVLDTTRPFFLVVLEGVNARSPSSGTPRVYQGDCGATKATHDTPGVNEFLPRQGGQVPQVTHSLTQIG